MFMSFATTEGSRKTMPLPLTCTSTLAVPRSMPISKLELQSAVGESGNGDQPAAELTRGYSRVSKNPAGSTSGVMPLLRCTWPPSSESSSSSRSYPRSIYSRPMISVSPAAARPAITRRGAGANVRRFDRRTRELRGAFDDRRVALHRDLDVGAHAREFVHVREARVENRLLDDARSRARCIRNDDHLRLQIGRKTRIRRGENLGAAGDAVCRRRESNRRRT